MHELYLAESILNIVQEYAAKHCCKKVNAVLLSCGSLSCIEPKALQFAFEMQAKGTIAENAVLEFKILLAAIHCFSCQKDIVVNSFTGACPNCGNWELNLSAGTEELKILEIDVD